MPDYICNFCGVSFSISDGCCENKNAVLRGVDKVTIRCPGCGAESYSVAYVCEECGDYFRYEDLVGGYYCDDCLERMSTPYHFKQYARENADDFAEWMHDRRKHSAKD